MNITMQAQPETTNMASITPAHFTVPAWLTKAITPAAVRNGLLQHTPEFSSGQLTIVECKVKRLRLRDGHGCWRGTCLLTFADASVNTEPQTVSLHSALLPPGRPEPDTDTERHPFGTAQWRCYLPELRLELSIPQPGSKLDALSDLTDPEAARRLLETSIQASGNPDYRNLHIQSCQPQVMRYKPGSRCTILYHLEYPATPVAKSDWPAVAVAKTYHGDKGKIAYEGMAALWRSPMRTSPTVTIAEPLAYMPESRVLVQGPIQEEMTLKDLMLEAFQTPREQSVPEPLDELYSYVRKTAAGLAELHQSGAFCGEVVTWEDELAEIDEDRATVAQVLPHFTNFADDLLDRLQELAATHPADRLAPAHRSFRPAQVLLHKGDIGFIDFDGFCRAEPAMDLALFMTTIKSLAHLKDKANKHNGAPVDSMAMSQEQVARLAQAEALCEFFLTEYEKHAAVSRTRIALWQTLQILSLVLGSWKKLKLERLYYCQFMLERHLQRHGLG